MTTGCAKCNEASVPGFAKRHISSGRQALAKVFWYRAFGVLMILFWLCFSSLAGCGSSPTGDLTHDYEYMPHTVTVDPDGKPVDPKTFHVLMQDASHDAFEEQLEIIVDKIEVSKKKKLLIFVHGGLNNQKGGQKHVEVLAAKMSQADYYPIFLNWNSDLLDTSWEELLYIRQGRTAKTLGPVSFPFALAAAVGSGVVRAPLVWGQMLASDINTTGLYDFPGKRNSQALAGQLKEMYDNDKKNAIRIAWGNSDIGTLDKVTAFGRYFLTFPFKLVTSPLIDGIGQGAWRNMLRRTQMLFHREDEFDVRGDLKDPEKLKEVLTQGPRGAAYQLFTRLQKYLTVVSKRNEELEVTFIGHSMGTIVFNRVLREFPDFPVTNIVYMAAACSIEDFRSSVVPYLQWQVSRQNEEKTKFFSLMLHPDAEEREWQELVLDLSPRGSLLVWIDNFLASPETTLDRTLGAWENIMQATHVIPQEVKSQITLKAFCVGDSCKGPIRHGDFTNPEFKFWLPNFWEIQAEL